MKNFKFVFTIIWFTILITFFSITIIHHIEKYHQHNIDWQDINFNYLKWKLQSIEGGDQIEIFKEYAYSNENLPMSVKDKIYNGFLEEIGKIK